MTRNPIRVALFAAILAACGSVPANTGATSSEDAGNNNRETAVANDVPSPPPDVAPSDAGPATPDAQDAQVADASPTKDVQERDTGTPDSGMVTIAFDGMTCARFGAFCWYFNDDPGHCETITCEMQSPVQGQLAMFGVFVTRLGYSRARCQESTSCDVVTRTGMPTGYRLLRLSGTMNNFAILGPDGTELQVTGRPHPPR